MAFPFKPRNDDVSIDIDAATPIRYLSLDHVYSATSPCVSASGSSNVMSKKVKARKLTHFENDDVSDHKPLPPLPPPSLPPPPQLKPEIVHVYTRRGEKRPRPSFYDAVVARAQPKAAVKVEEVDEEEYVRLVEKKKKKKKSKFASSELVKLGVDSDMLRALDAPRLREYRSSNQKPEKSSSKKRNSTVNGDKAPPSVKRWVGLSFSAVDPKTFIGLQCKASTL